MIRVSAHASYWKAFAYGLAVLPLLACEPSTVQAHNDTSLPQTHTPAIIATHDDIEPAVNFSDVLQAYQDLNARLDRVSAPLLLANAPVCPKTHDETGIRVHTLTDYPKDLRPVAQHFLSVSDALSIRTVRPQSAAAIAGIRQDDIMINIAGMAIPTGFSAPKFYDAVMTRIDGKGPLTFTLKRGEEMIHTTLEPERACDYPVNVVFSEDINAFTDGEAIVVSSTLIRTLEDDHNLAFIIAHELAHAITHDVTTSPRAELELEADRRALELMHRAGYDIRRTADFWDTAPHPHEGATHSHPDILQRRAHFQAALEDILASHPLTQSEQDD